jgi:hypothetical protein
MFMTKVLTFSLNKKRSWHEGFMLGIVIIAMITFATAKEAKAFSIGPGFDLYTTQAGTTIDLDLGTPVNMVGAPIGPGNTDTIVQRHTGTSSGFDVGDTGTIQVELVALSLQSAAPVEFGGQLFDVSLISGRLLSPTLENQRGEMTVDHTYDYGGFFEMDTPMNAQITLTQVGQTNPEVIGPVFANTFLVTTTGQIWSHFPIGWRDGIQSTEGDFHPGVLPLDFGGPSPEIVQFWDRDQTFSHFLLPAATASPSPIPEPTTVVLLGIGLVGLAGTAAKRRRKKKAVDNS